MKWVQTHFYKRGCQVPKLFFQHWSWQKASLAAQRELCSSSLNHTGKALCWSRGKSRNLLWIYNKKCNDRVSVCTSKKNCLVAYTDDSCQIHWVSIYLNYPTTPSDSSEISALIRSPRCWACGGFIAALAIDTHKEAQMFSPSTFFNNKQMWLPFVIRFYSSPLMVIPVTVW